VRRPQRPSAFSNALVFGWRATLKFKHLPEQLFDLVMTPIMFTLLFTFVFGGALAGSPGVYLQFFLPGILVQTVAFNAVYSGMNLSTDLGKGLFDRFRSLPIWSLAPFAGLMVGDILRHLIAATIILTIGLILGYPPGSGDRRCRRRLRAAPRDRLRHGLDFHRSRATSQDADDSDDARLHPAVPACLCLERHGRARDDAGLAARYCRGESGVSDDHRRSRLDERRCDSSRHPTGACRACGPDRPACAIDALALPEKQLNVAIVWGSLQSGLEIDRSGGSHAASWSCARPLLLSWPRERACRSQ
jgi:hypothetical protein